jgi:hypothetical protein
MILMTPLIRDVGRARFSQRMPFALARGAGYFLFFILWLITGSCVSLAAPPQSSQDPNAKPAPAPTTQQPPAAASNPSPRVSTESTPLQKAVHQKKVITEEDLAKRAKIITLKDLEGEENNPTCDLSCEAELREQMGLGPEREAEFRNQLTLARHEIGDDRVWTSTLQDALQAASGYCDIQRQVAKIVGKGVVSEYIRNNVHSQFAERERNFVSQYRNSTGLLTQRIEAVQRFAPFRATVMQYQRNEAIARVCPDYTLP